MKKPGWVADYRPTASEESGSCLPAVSPTPLPGGNSVHCERPDLEREGQAARHVGVEINLRGPQRAETAGGAGLGGGHDGGGDGTDFDTDAAGKVERVRLDGDVECQRGVINSQYDYETSLADRHEIAALVPGGARGEGGMHERSCACSATGPRHCPCRMTRTSCLAPRCVTISYMLKATEIPTLEIPSGALHSM
jgi:hypothetical protein